MSHRYKPPTPPDWRDQRAMLLEARKDLTAKWERLTPIEREERTEDLNELRNEVYQSISAGTLESYNRLIELLQDSRAAVKKARDDEARRYDLSKMAGEMTAIDLLLKVEKRRVENGDHGAVKSVQRLYDECLKSGDVNRIRGVCEILKGAAESWVGMVDHEAVLAINRLSDQAKRQLYTLRNETSEILAAQEAEELAAQYLARFHSGTYQEPGELQLTHEALEGPGNAYGNIWGNSPMQRAAKKLHFDQDGNIEILADDDPRITGIVMRAGEAQATEAPKEA